MYSFKFYRIWKILQKIFDELDLWIIWNQDTIVDELAWNIKCLEI